MNTRRSTKYLYKGDGVGFNRAAPAENGTDGPALPRDKRDIGKKGLEDLLKFRGE